MPVLIGRKLVVDPTGVITADGEGDLSTDIGCYGGSSYGIGGGQDPSPPTPLYDLRNPNLYGGSGGVCGAGQYGPKGGGVINVATNYLLNQNSISANGAVGGGGGTVRIHAGQFDTASGRISVNGVGDNPECGGGGIMSFMIALNQSLGTNVKTAGSTTCTGPHFPGSGVYSTNSINVLVVNQVALHTSTRYGIEFKEKPQNDTKKTKEPAHRPAFNLSLYTHQPDMVSNSKRYAQKGIK